MADDQLSVIGKQVTQMVQIKDNVRSFKIQQFKLIDLENVFIK